jgi:putative Holliday junction resolvase
VTGAGPVLAVDVGSKRVGLAVSDDTGTVALPLETVAVTSTAKASARVAEIAVGRGAAGIVVGHPLNMNGTLGPAAARAERFAALLAGATGLPVTLRDERLTTSQAERSLIGQGVRRERRREIIDQVAAALLLQAHLDERNR